ncbi:serine/threonine protein kinase [Caballeronia choica]|uniref:Serine/threonine protein kinase n=2 Tax=Caballeronia choica TaxID=326476 RepID=A0A158L200_9BURK|nr:serine/threonine protein kinase [Caballeronia choica]
MPVEPQFAVGKCILNEFRVEEHLGAGAHGAVYRVVSEKTGETFALKRALIQDKHSRTELIREVQASMNLPVHPHVASCKFFQLVDDDAIFIFSEYVDGGSLSDRLASRAIYRSDPMENIEQILRLGIESGWGIHAVHSAAQVHQDIKPSNVLLTRAGTAKVTDFGLSQAPRVEHRSDFFLHDLGTDRASNRVRDAFHKFMVENNGRVAGRGKFTAQYASPEQLSGATLTPATDVWSWAVLLLEVFCGKRTWEMGVEAPSALHDLVDRGPIYDGPPPLISRVARLLECCLQEEPARRPPIVDATEELRLAYEEHLRRKYPCTMPEIIHPFVRAFVRELPSGDRWTDPRIWLDAAYELRGVPSEAPRHYPDPAGSAKARALSEMHALEHALEIFEQAREGGKEALNHDIAKIDTDLGYLLAYLGDGPRALRYFRAAVALLTSGTEASEPFELMCLWNSMAYTLKNIGSEDEALKVCDDAISHWHNIDASLPPYERNRGLGLIYNTRASVTADATEAKHFRLEAVALLERGSAIYVRCLGGLATDHARLGEWDAFDECIACTSQLAEELIASDDREDMNGWLASFTLNQGVAELWRGRFEEARDRFKEAAEKLDKIEASEGHEILAPVAARSHYYKATALIELGDHANALLSYAAARERFLNLVFNRGRSDLVDELMTVLREEAALCASRGAPEQTLALARQAAELLSRLPHGQQDGRRRAMLVHLLTLQSNALLGQDCVQEAVATARQAIELYESLSPESAELNSLDRCRALSAFGMAARRANDPDSCWNAYRCALDILKRHRSTAARVLMAQIYFNSSNLLDQHEDRWTALQYLDEAIEILEVEDKILEAEASGSSNAQRVNDDLILAYLGKVDQLVKIGDYAQALAFGGKTLPILERTATNRHSRVFSPLELAKFWGHRGRLSRKVGDLHGSADAFCRAGNLYRAVNTSLYDNEINLLIDHLVHESERTLRLASLAPNDVRNVTTYAWQFREQAIQFSRNDKKLYACEAFDESITCFRALIVYQEQKEKSRFWPGTGRLKPNPQEDFADTQIMLAQVAGTAHRDVAAKCAFRAAIIAYDRLVLEAPNQSVALKRAAANTGVRAIS